LGALEGGGADGWLRSRGAAIRPETFERPIRFFRVVLLRGGGGVRGFLSFLIDALVLRSCLVCERELGPFDQGAWTEPRSGRSRRSRDFFAERFVFELQAGIAVPATVLCPECWMRLEPAGPPGRIHRFEIHATDVPVIAPFFTNDELLTIIRFLKFSFGRTAVPALGWWMARSLEDHIGIASARRPYAPMLVPVPLHPAREKSRGYNQASLLACNVAGRLGLEVGSRILERTRNTKSQSTLDPQQRSKNVRGAFELLGGDLINSKDIIVIDDLVTTGETAGACIAALEEGFPSSLAVLTAGRIRD
jgi:predicted amidophosphoribosyltransferase